MMIAPTLDTESQWIPTHRSVRALFLVATKFDAYCSRFNFFVFSVIFSLVDVPWGKAGWVQVTDLRTVSVFFGKARGKAPIKQDNISLTVSFLVASELVLFDTFPNFLQFDSVLAAIIIIVGLLFSWIFKFSRGPAKNSRSKEVQLLFATVSEVVAFLVINAFVSNIPLSLISDFGTISVVQQRIFLVLIAVAEEQFFRGVWLNWFIKYAGEGWAITLDSVFFMLYHSYVYGGDIQAQIVVLLAGGVICAADIKTGRVSPGILGHVINNLGSG